MDGESPALRLGTSSWSSRDWVGPFYPPGTRPERFIEHYATVFDTVEIDATFYRPPTAKNVDAWRRRTPEGFEFAIKTPRVVTHDKVLEDVDDDVAYFLDTVGELGSRLGPVLLQFPYFNKRAFDSPAPFLERLDRFLGTLPREVRFAVEVRNRNWVGPDLQRICAAHRVALAWVAQAWMPGPGAWPKLTGGPTTDFAYLRWLGDRKRIEDITKNWGETVIDRSADLEGWIPVVRDLLGRSVKVYGYFNNHFAGHAPATVELFRRLLAVQE